MNEEARWRAAWEVAYGRHECDFQEPVVIDDQGSPPRHGGYRCACGGVCWVRGKSIFVFTDSAGADPMLNLQAAVRRHREGQGRQPFVPHLVRCTCGAKGTGALGIVYEHADGCPAGEPESRRQAATLMRAVDSQGRVVHDFDLAAGDVAARILKDTGITSPRLPGAYPGPAPGPDVGPAIGEPVTVASYEEFVKLFGPRPLVDWAAVAEKFGLPPYAPSWWERIGDRVSIWQWRRRLDAAQLLWRLGRPRAERLASWIVQDPSA